MKKLLLLLFVLPLMAFHPGETDVNIIGTWKGEDKGDIGFVTFDEEGYALFEANGEKMGGREFMMDGKKANMTYSLNTDTDPLEIDFTVTIIGTEEASKLLGIINFINEDKMNFAIGFGGIDRPSEFNDENSIVFERQN